MSKKKKALVLDNWPCSECGAPSKLVHKPGMTVEWCDPCAARRRLSHLKGTLQVKVTL